MATNDELEPGVTIKIPAGVAGARRAWCLRITDVAGVEWESGEMGLAGYKLDVDGTTTRRIPAMTVVSVAPGLVTVVARPDPDAVPASLDIKPSPTQIAVAHLPAGIRAWLHVRDDDGDAAVRGLYDEHHPQILIVPGDRRGIGWGVWVARYHGLSGIRNGHRPRDRDVWHEAARRVADGGVVYVQLEQQDVYSRQVWVATSVVDGPALPEGKVTHGRI